MASAEPRELSEAQSHIVAVAIREALARRRISRQRLADDAKISISTLKKALNGSRGFTLATLVRLEAALGVALRPGVEDRSFQAPAELGGYARSSVKWLEGDYLTLRPSFEAKDAIFAYRTKILWNEARLTFQESDRRDAPFSQKGVISMPNKSGQIYLHTNEQGQMRLAILGRPLITGEMYGVLTTLAVGAGSNLLPVAVPIALIPLPDGSNPVFGRLTRADDAFTGYAAHLNRLVADGYARLIVMPSKAGVD